MMRQRRLISRKPWQSIAGSFVRPILTFQMMCASIMYVSETWAFSGLECYVLPRYPEVYRRARIQASFLVEVVEVKIEATQTTVTVVSYKSRSPSGSHEADGPFDLSHPNLMMKNIIEALSRWRIGGTEEKTFAVTIIFRLSDRMSDYPRYTYRIEEEGKLPKEIIVEVDQPAIQTTSSWYVPRRHRQSEALEKNCGQADLDPSLVPSSGKYPRTGSRVDDVPGEFVPQLASWDVDALRHMR